MTQQDSATTPPALPHYRVDQLHSLRLGNQPVTSFESLVTHHPIANAQARVLSGVPAQVEDPRRRSHGLIGGEMQEIETTRTDSGAASALQEHQVLLMKDFLLEDSRIASGVLGVRAVDVPSPCAGYINAVNPRLGSIDIYDRQGGELIARVLHLDPYNVEVGDSIGYGQSLGTQSNRGAEAIHVHMEVDTRYYQQYENYMEDLVRGRACMAASVACVAKANGLSQIDHVLLSEARGGVGQGDNLFVVQGAPGDPARVAQNAGRGQHTR